MTVDKERIEKVAAARWERYERLKGRTYRPFAYEGKHNRFYVGLLGEATFGDKFGLPVDFDEKPGDGGKDFILSTGMTVNVRTFRKPYHLTMNPNEPKADAYVLAGYSDRTDTVWLVGWATREDMEKAPLIDLGHFGLPVHCLRAELLYPINSLLRMHKEG